MHGDAMPFSLVLPFFAIVRIYITVGRLVVDILGRRRTSYAVTSERIVFVTGLFTQTVTSLALATVTDVRLVERGDGSGNITFGPINPWRGAATIRGWPGMSSGSMFERIPSARAVYDIIGGAQRAASRSDAS
jgi:hypothetical protein